jgi:hypothetical protein
VADTGSSEAPGTFAAFSTAPLAEDTDVVGIPQLTVKLDAPTFAASQAAGPAGMLVLFAKLYDVDPGSGDAVLPQNLVSAVRIPDVTKPVSIELAGIAHRFAKGHQMKLVLTSSDVVYRNTNGGGPVSVAIDPASPSTLRVPILGRQDGPTGSGPGGTTPFTAAPGAPKPQKDGFGLRAPALPRAAKLPSAKRCLSRRVFRITLRRPADGARIRSVRVTVNGKRVKAHLRRGRRPTARVDLRGLKRGTVRVLITVRTVRGRTLRSARTYHTCVAKKKP